MMRVGLIRNARSHRNRTPDELFCQTATALLGDCFAEPASPQELEAVLDAFVLRGVELLIIDGGDGTLHKVLGALPPKWVEAPPFFAILPSGNTNLVAADVGCTQRGVAGLRRLLNAVKDDSWRHQVQRRHVMDIVWTDQSYTSQRGMFFGAAAFTRGIDIAHEGVHRQGLFQKLAVLVTIALSGLQLLHRKSRNVWLAGEPMSVDIDMQGAREGARFLFLATSLQKMFFGIWPFWNGEAAALRFLDVDANPRDLFKAGFSVLCGRQPQWLKAHEHYQSGGAARIGLELSHRFVIDGEIFEPGPSGRIILTAGPSLEFLVL